ncbi:SDR family NAD(P)-dependent oxidoreductase [Microcella daejeonensis]|uniref:SDR family NAD(P)-dependent oxidoreductase n=1 Tax=Microcella daejeonensis TaxID=2994971 RepID=UPI002271C2B5|nr:SDR family oxidoreductase [Microcella daejeonensis]WAB82988.1 SDR family NAD(P)-dependent oxidoreductase [Microcella daejeonensis]
MAELAGSSILIIGATGGLGRHIARQLADAGANLTLTARSQQALDELGIPGTHIAGDLTDPELPETLVALAVMAHGRLDGVINAAGVVAFGPVAETSDATLDELWTVNALAPMRVLRAAVPALEHAKEDGGTPFIVTLSGVVSENPTAGLGAYSAVKTAVAAFHSVAARELRRQGIRVMDARPGHTETELSRHPIAGETPKFPTGYDPAGVAARIVAGIVNDEKDLPSSAFTEIPHPEATMVAAEPVEAGPDAHPAVKMAAEMPLEVSASAPTDASASSPASAGSAGSPASVDSPASPGSADSAASSASAPSAPSASTPGSAPAPTDDGAPAPAEHAEHIEAEQQQHDGGEQHEPAQYDGDEQQYDGSQHDGDEHHDSEQHGDPQHEGDQHRD